MAVHVEHLVGDGHHTAPVRQYFEQDLSKKYATVIGAEAGFMANYPYLTVSAFTNNGGRPVGDNNQNYVINPQGFGTAVNGGWRDLAWGLGGSFMLKTRLLGVVLVVFAAVCAATCPDCGGSAVYLGVDTVCVMLLIWLMAVRLIRS
mgnify:CR=1 FL=1